MSKIIRSKFKAQTEKAMLGFEYAINDLAGYLASRFEESMIGLGTRDEAIIRFFGRNRDVNLLEAVKKAYERIYGKSLRERMEGKASGDFRRLVTALLDRKQ